MKNLFVLIFLFTTSFSFSQLQINQTNKTDANLTYHDDLLGEVLTDIFIALSYGILFETGMEYDTPMHYASISPYPYFVKSEGNYTYKGESVPFRFEINSNLVFDNSKNISGIYNAKLRFFKRFDITANYVNFLNEDNQKNKFLSQTSLLFNYHRIRTKRLDIWYGLGALFLGNDFDETGLSLSLGGEYFINYPVSLEAKAQWGYFDNVIIRNTEFNMNYFVSHWRFQLGLQSYRLQYDKINTIKTGVKYYF